MWPCKLCSHLSLHCSNHSTSMSPKWHCLTRVAKTAQGAMELLRWGLVAQLVECQVFHMLPQNVTLRVFEQRDPSGFIPSPLERYRQILLPTLRLMQVILTSTTTHHQQGAARVLKHPRNASSETG
ncbi:nuclear pore complex protein Nup205-like [Carassius carassius]|uniref:nuclear pore complex protein Nup205-like n=1 Tax=Carassius carassius TaxID=217509 RepID=UPI002868FB52|nr:nuclear pore complex protein Nup205-like [Carassius carassius]